MIDTTEMLEKKVWEALQQVTDPEMPTVSLIELGMVEQVTVQGEKASVRIIPTYVGCPALDLMRRDVVASLNRIEGVREVEVEFAKSPSWTSDRITPEGREKLKEYGIASPARGCQPRASWEITCPYCGSKQTVMENLFGPTACRSIFYCNTCKNPFETIKPV